MVFRQLRRNPRRTVLTFLGLVISFFLYTILQSVLATMDRQLEISADEAVLVVGPRNVTGIGLPELPRSYVSQLRDTEGILAVSPVRFFAGTGRRENSIVVALGVELDSFLDIYAIEGVTPDEVASMSGERSAALVGRALLEDNGWKLGDRVNVRSPVAGLSLPVSLVGDIDREDRFGALMLVDIQYMENVVGDPGRASFIQAKIARPEYAATLGRLIDARFSNFTVPTDTTSEKAHMANVISGLSEAFNAFEAIGYLTLLVTVLVVANSVSMSVRERTVEIATMRALGFSKSWVTFNIVGESVLVATLGALAGAGLAVAVAIALNAGAGADEASALPATQLVVDASVLGRAVLFAVPVGALAALQPVISAVRMPIAIALRFAV